MAAAALFAGTYLLAGTWGRMNVRQLRFFCLAARDGTFSAAAREEGVTVQAVSKSIHELEEELGGALFARAGKGMALTPLGEKILEPAPAARSTDSKLMTAARGRKKGRPGARPRLSALLQA